MLNLSFVSCLFFSPPTPPPPPPPAPPLPHSRTSVGDAKYMMVLCAILLQCERHFEIKRAAIRGGGGGGREGDNITGGRLMAR